MSMSDLWLTVIKAASALLVLSNANYLAQVMRVYTTSFIATVPLIEYQTKMPFYWESQFYVDSGLNCIVQLVEIMQLSAKPQCVGGFPPCFSVAWSLFLMT